MRRYKNLPNALHLSFMHPFVHYLLMFIRQMLNLKNRNRNYLGVSTIDEFLYSSEFKDAGILFDVLIFIKFY